MKRPYTVFAIVLLITVHNLSYSASETTPTSHSSIPYVATRSDIVKDMLWMADVGKDDVLYDLGSGDGRIVIASVRDFNARRAVGIEIDPERVRQSKEMAQKAGVTDRVKLIEGDLFTEDFREATVVTAFLGSKPNIRLRSKMLSILKPGTRIVSHQFGMGEWPADKTLTVRTDILAMYSEPWHLFNSNPRVPDYRGNEGRIGVNDKILMWLVPAPLAGIWRGKVKTEQGPQEFRLVLHQRLSEVRGAFQLKGKANLVGRVRFNTWGDHVRYSCNPDKEPYGSFRLMFDGHVHTDTMRGTLAVQEQGRVQEGQWEAEREKVDITGTWEWPCDSASRLVRLRIEREDGRLVATYLDQNRATSVADFYDHGGGFYFTLFVGRGLRVTKDTGWLTVEAVLDDGVLKGKSEFYRYGGVSGKNNRIEPHKPVIQEWTSQLVKHEETQP